jgi:hypothetical protein
VCMHRSVNGLLAWLVFGVYEFALFESGHEMFVLFEVFMQLRIVGGMHSLDEFARRIGALRNDDRLTEDDGNLQRASREASEGASTAGERERARWPVSVCLLTGCGLGSGENQRPNGQMGNPTPIVRSVYACMRGACTFSNSIVSPSERTGTSGVPCSIAIRMKPRWRVTSVSTCGSATE